MSKNFFNLVFIIIFTRFFFLLINIKCEYQNDVHFDEKLVIILIRSSVTSCSRSNHFVYFDTMILLFNFLYREFPEIVSGQEWICMRIWCSTPHLINDAGSSMLCKSFIRVDLLSRINHLAGWLRRGTASPNANVKE